MPLVYLSIGSNEGEPRRNVEVAIELIGSRGGMVIAGQGGVYETEPQGKRDQAWFVNTAAKLETNEPPEALLRLIKSVEEQMGRVTTPARGSTPKWGPRVIDIDIVFYNSDIVNTEKLSIPHPRAHERRFVLRPIADIDPGFIHPVIGKSVFAILADIPAEGQEMRRIDL
ncbi:2-amino-4-hydroxy-6-hydroxymethyldihydropteridinepyrophosphokinase [hydrothermal vent metagenome]|uniref:2-amino-4-hydroxy-6-hydroxymethyldihydropteridine diphosphokinase n=1 Tax=hydrothermal vent metagenome TaxID=652676 RepID=A0A3B1CJE6_9ZZZZ